MSDIPLLYKDRREEGDTLLRQCQLVQLHLLHVFHDICEKHKLKYILHAGTALGAIRHGGFIPWDDDLDVAMPRKDYDMFRKIMKKELPADVDSSSNGIRFPFMKLRDRYSTFFEVRRDINMDEGCGIYIDVMPLDYYPSAGFRFWKVLRKFCSYSWRRERGMRMRVRRNIWNSLYALPLSLVFTAAHRLTRAIISLAVMILGDGIIGYSYEHRHFWWFKTSDVFPLKMVKFEDGMFWHTNDPDATLTSEFGDWRQIPPPEKRPKHATLILPMQAPAASWAMEYPIGGRDK